MQHYSRQRRALHTWLSAALLLGQVAIFAALPRPAQAALSADPNAEIVYIDDNDVIRVLDLQGNPLVQWVSPDGGWDQIVLLDVQDDGDMEILALDKQDDNNARVTLFDPVLARGATDPNKQINGIPWDILWSVQIAGNAEYVVGGNFDANIPGDEIVVGFRNGDTSIVQIYNATGVDPSTQKPTGRDWKIHIQKEYPQYEYTYGIAGELIGDGAEELALFDPESATTRLDIYRPDQDMLLLDSETASNDRFKQGAIGQVLNDGPEDLVAILTVDRPAKESLRIYVMGNDGEIEADAAWAFAPQPEMVFLADIRGNGDKEVFFLRNYPVGSEGARLIMRDDWGTDQRQNENLIEWNLMDDGDNNEFRAGAGADVDGDGREEVIIMRDDRIRVYNNPENGNESSSNYTDYPLPTDNRRINLLAGDLDRNGFSTGPILLTDRNLIEATVPLGARSADQFVNVTNIGTQGGVGMSAIIPATSGWAKVSPTFATTPATFRVWFESDGLAPGIYNSTLTLRSNQSNVQNDNIVIALKLTVVPPELEPTPPQLWMLRYPCAGNTCTPAELEERNEPFTTTIRINGTTDLAFTAAILGVPSLSDNIATVAGSAAGLAGPITAGELDANGNIVLSDSLGNSQTLAANSVSTSAVHTGTIYLDPSIPWITSANLSGNVAPADLSLVISPTTVLTDDVFHREFAVLVLVADTRAGVPGGSVKLVPIQLANIGDINWVSFIAKE